MSTIEACPLDSGRCRQLRRLRWPRVHPDYRFSICRAILEPGTGQPCLCRDAWRRSRVQSWPRPRVGAVTVFVIPPLHRAQRWSMREFIDARGKLLDTTAILVSSCSVHGSSSSASRCGEQLTWSSMPLFHGIKSRASSRFHIDVAFALFAYVSPA